MNERLEIRLGEYLLSERVSFSRVTDTFVDPDTGTLDIWYKNQSNMTEVNEVRDIEDFLDFLVSGGK